MKEIVKFELTPATPRKMKATPIRKYGREKKKRKKVWEG